MIDGYYWYISASDDIDDLAEEKPQIVEVCSGYLYLNGSDVMHFIKEAKGEFKGPIYYPYEISNTKIDRSEKADAKRMRWLLNGNGYYMEENMLCGHEPCNEKEQDEARKKIDMEMDEN